MKKLFFLFLLCLINENSFSQTNETKLRSWPFQLSITTPNVLYSVQRANMQELQNSSNPNFFRNKTRLPVYEVLKGSFIFDEHYVLGTQIGFSSRGKLPKLQSSIEEQHPDYHILNYWEEGPNFFVPRFFAGYQYILNKKIRHPHVIALMFYLNFDYYDYGTYRYEAKYVANNDFHTYSLNTEVKNSKSLTIELQKHRYYQLKDSLKGWNIGVKFGVTPRNQEITLIEIRKDGTTDVQTVSNSTFDLKSWTFYFGFQFSFVSTPTYSSKRKKK